MDVMRDVLLNVLTGGLCVKNAVLNRVYLADSKKRFFINFRVSSKVWYVHLATQNTVSTV